MRAAAVAFALLAAGPAHGQDDISGLRQQITPLAPARVVDGDTIRVGEQRIRIFGLDCAELGAPGGREAKRALERLVQGRRVTLEYIERDRYGRMVAKVSVGGRDVTCTMIRAGACAEFLRYSRGAYAACLP